jgi:ABC-type multidrug transport system ATPase subunit
MSAIRTEKLSKRYGATLALDRLDLTVDEGEVYGYLGPNGAGKTTTIRLLLGLHRPSAGRAALFGVDAWSDPVTAHRRVAYVAGEPFLWPALTSAETFEFLARLHGATDVAYRDQLVDRGQGVFLASHILSEVEAVCDRVGILRDGKLVDQGTLAELRHLGVQTVEVTFTGPAPELPTLAGVQAHSAGRNGLRFEVSGSVGPLIAALAGHPVATLTSREPSLEEIFLHHYDGSDGSDGHVGH